MNNINSNDLAILLKFMMLTDPWEDLTDIESDALNDMANKLAINLGYSDWIDAYHKLKFEK